MIAMTDRSVRRGRTKWFRPRLQSPGECVDVEKETAEDEKKIKEELWKEKQEALLLLAKEAKDRRMKKSRMQDASFRESLGVFKPVLLPVVG